MKRSRGLRSKSRSKLRKGRFSIVGALQEFNEDDSVRIHINPSVHTGLPHPRYQGRTGKIVEKRGRAYLVKLKDGSKERKLIAKPDHLQSIVARSRKK